MNGERVHAARQFVRKNAINHAVALDPGLTFERLRHDIDPEMSLPARPGASMAFMLVQFVHHIEALRLKASVNFFVMRSAVRMLPSNRRGRLLVNACFVAIRGHRSNVKS